MYKVCARAILIVFIALPLVQCGLLGESGQNSKIKFKATPKSPVVINSDFTLVVDPGFDNIPGTADDLDTQDVKGPWFLVSFVVTNDSDTTITVQNISLEVVSFDQFGTTNTTTTDLDPGDLEPAQAYLLQVPAGGTSITSGWYIHGLNDQAVGFSYNVTASIQGWFGTSNNPEKRIEKTTSFVTK